MSDERDKCNRCGDPGAFTVHFQAIEHRKGTDPHKALLVLSRHADLCSTCRRAITKRIAQLLDFLEDDK